LTVHSRGLGRFGACEANFLSRGGLRLRRSLFNKICDRSWLRYVDGVASLGLNDRSTRGAYRADLTDRVISAEQGKPVALLARGKSIAIWTDGDASNGNGSKRRLPCNRADRGCVASWGQHHLTGNGADFLLVLKLETA